MEVVGWDGSGGLESWLGWIGGWILGGVWLWRISFFSLFEVFGWDGCEILEFVFNPEGGI